VTDDAGARRALFLRHHLEDDPGLVGAALTRRGFTVDVLLVEDGAAPVDLEHVDVLCVLGSKWSVYDHEAVGGWIDTELHAIREADRAGIPVLGICFGSQALCAALGGSVEPAPRAEIGWVPLEAAQEHGLPSGPWFQFHADQCIVPLDATVLARNDVCVQAFRVGRHLGVQFHPELDATQFSRWLDAGADIDVKAAGLSPAALLAETVERQSAAAPRVNELVAGFLERGVC